MDKRKARRLAECKSIQKMHSALEAALRYSVQRDMGEMRFFTSSGEQFLVRRGKRPGMPGSPWVVTMNFRDIAGTPHSLFIAADHSAKAAVRSLKAFLLLTNKTEYLR